MTDIKPEQVPEAAAHALIQSDIMLMSAKEQIAAALNAWPGMIVGNSLFDGEPMAFLPLPKEPSNG